MQKHQFKGKTLLIMKLKYSIHEIKVKHYIRKIIQSIVNIHIYVRDSIRKMISSLKMYI